MLSIVTGTKDRPESFVRLLESIQENTKVEWELIVSDASIKSYGLNLPENVTLFPDTPPTYCTKGYNRAFRLAKYDWVVWLNDDCEVVRDWDVRAINFMKQFPEIGLGAFYFKDGSDRFYRVYEYQKMIYANFGIISRVLGNRLGWFDEFIKMYGCDNSLCFKVLLSGRGIGCIPKGKIIHHREQDELRQENEAGQDEDAQRLMKRYKKWLPYMQTVYNRFEHLNTNKFIS